MWGLALAGLGVIAIGVLIIIFRMKVTTFSQIYHREQWGARAPQYYRPWTTVVGGALFIAVGVLFISIIVAQIVITGEWP